MDIILVGGPQDGETRDSLPDSVQEILRMYVGNVASENPEVIYRRTDKSLNNRVVFVSE